MKFSTTAIVLAAAIGASAHPSGHGHQHVHRSLEQRDGNKFVMNVKPEPTTTKEAPKEPTGVVNAAAAVDPPKKQKSKPKPKPAPEPKPDPPKKQKPSPPKGGAGGGSGEGVSSYTPFCGGKKRATDAEIHYKGNLGTSGDYGCNMMLAQSQAAKEYDYKLQLKNVADEQATCNCFLKVGPTGGINGFFKDNEILSFKMAPGAEQWVVADKNTQGACACTTDSTFPYTDWGESGGVWAEFDFDNDSNEGWSGADASCLTATRAKMSFPGMRICAEGSGSPCSVIKSDGSGSNSFLEGMEAEDGWGINATPGPLTLKVEVGYSG